MALISKVRNMGETMVSQASEMLQMPKLQSTQDDDKGMQQILSTHAPEAHFVFDEKALLTMAEFILHNATPTALADPKTDNEVLIEKVNQQAITDALAFTIHKIRCELSCNCSGEGDVKLITLAVLDTLVKYSWNGKLVLALSAFAVSYGEFCLISQLHVTNPIAKTVILLKQQPDISERESLITSLLKVVMDMTKCVMDLQDLPSQCSRDKPPLSDALGYVPIAVYWAIKSIVACASESIGLINIGHGQGYVTSIAGVRKKLNDLTQTLNSIHTYLQKQLVLCLEKIEKWKLDEGYHNFKSFMKSSHKDIMEVLLKVIDTKDAQPLFDGVNKKRINLDVLSGKTVILFISYPDISVEEIKEIVQMGGKKERQYEVVWLPIIERSLESTQQQEIDRKASLMPWYSLHSSLSPQSVVIRYIKEVWQFEQKSLLVVLNPKGQVVCTNAYHMIMTWGIEAFPFDTQREKTLWSKTTWSLDFLIGEMDSNKQQWLNEGRFICFYGGEDVDWINTFTTTMKEVAKAAKITLEMIYIGKKQNLITCWDQLKIRRFKARLEGMLYSKIQLGLSIANDTVMKELMILLGSDGSGQGWTMIGHGLKDMITVNGEKIMKCLLIIKNSGVKITSENFFSILDNAMKEVQNSITPAGRHKHCIHISLPNGVAANNVICSDCNRPMEKYLMFKCCPE